MSSPVTVTATVFDPGNNLLQGNAFVRFRLRNFDGLVPIVSGTGVFAETQIDAFPNSMGAVSQTLWGNNSINGNTYYTVEFHNNGRITSSGNYNISGSTNLNTAATISPSPVPSGPNTIIFQNNGAMNSSQTTLNLENTDGSLTITDEGSGTLNLIANATSFTVAGIGGFWGAGIPMMAGIYQVPTLSAVSPSTSSDQISVFLFQLTTSYTIRTVSAYIVSGGIAGSTMNFGIYSTTGAKLIDSGGLTASSSSTAESVTLGAPVVLAPGSYYFAQSSHSTSATCTGYGVGSAPLEAIINARTTVKVGQAANSTASGVMPSTLGTITSDALGGVGMAAAFFGV